MLQFQWKSQATKRPFKPKQHKNRCQGAVPLDQIGFLQSNSFHNYND